jgi:hypothetical protein
MVPVNVGLALITTLPVPVIAFDTKTFEPSVNTGSEAVRLEAVIVPAIVKAEDRVNVESNEGAVCSFVRR